VPSARRNFVARFFTQTYGCVRLKLGSELFPCPCPSVVHHHWKRPLERGGLRFVDTYFEDSLENLEEESEAGYSSGPFTRSPPLSGAPLDPRAYFLRALDLRLKDIDHEWTEVPIHAGKGIRECTDVDFHVAICGPRDPCRAADAFIELP
jgi:hypothetical protein